MTMGASQFLFNRAEAVRIISWRDTYSLSPQWGEGQGEGW